jgi:glycosyl transferase, family 25
MKTHIIHLSQNDFSVKMANETIESLKKFNIEYELFDGVVGNKGIEILSSQHNVFPSSHISKTHWSDGTIGCLASHYLLWDKCSKQDEPFLILEQDAILIKDPRELLPEIKKVCHLDAYLPFENQKNIKTHFEEYNKAVEKYKPGISKHPKNQFYGKNKLMGGGCFRGCYGYIMTPSGAKDIINFISNYGAFPSDGCINFRATNIERANSTYVRLNPFFQSLKLQKQYSLR